MNKACIGAAFFLLLSGAASIPQAQAGFLFNSRFDDFKELAQAGKVEDAAALYARELGYFSDLKGDKRKFVDEVMGQRDRLYAEQLNAALARLTQADGEPGQMLRWQRLKEELPGARTELAFAGTLAARGALTNAAMGALNANADRIAQSLQAEAPQALLDYGLFTEPSFKDQYPVAVRWDAFKSLPAGFHQELGKASAARLATFRKVYGDTLIVAQRLDAKVSEYYVAARTTESGARSYIAKSLVRERLAREGWKPAANAQAVLLVAWPAPVNEVARYQLAPPTLTAYQPVESDQTPDAFVAAGGARGRELLVFVRSSRLQMQRDESNQRQVGSQYQSGTRRVANPDYAQARQALASAQSSLASVRQASANASTDSSSTLGIMAAVIGAVSESSAESDVRDAQNRLAATPQSIEEAVLSAYSYVAKTVMVKQSVANHYAVYDTGTGQVVTGTINRTFSKTFTVADALRADDPDRAQILKSAQTPADVDAWVKGDIRDKYDEIWAAILADYKKKSLGI
jgi:hypothetical protein